MTFDAYKALPATNFSSLKHILTSPHHYKVALATESEESLDMRLGTAVHEFILEGRVRPYVVRPDHDPENPAEPWHGGRKSCKAWIKAQSLPWYSPDDESRMMRMQQALANDPLFQKILAMCPEREKTVEANYGGVDMKARLDMVGFYEGRRLIVDLKKTPDSSPRAWGKKANSFHYDMQCCTYSNLLALEEGCEEPPMVLHAVVEDSDAAPVTIFSVPQAEWQSGMAKLERAIKRLKECRETDEWPAYSDGKVTDPIWPRWADGEEDVAA